MSKHKLFRVNQYAILKNAHEKVLILKGEDVWELPGGRLEEGETPQEGLLREIREETGIAECDIEKTVDIHLSESGNTYMVAMFCCTTKEEVTLSDEHTDFAWVKKEDIDKYEYDFERTKNLLKKFS